MTDLFQLRMILQGGPGEMADRVEVLTRVVRDLMMEVEALRAAVQVLSDRAGPVDDGDAVPLGVTPRSWGPPTAYATAYASTAWLTHNSAGPSSGWEKLIDLFFTRGWRELPMLRRLGFTESQVAAFVEAAEAARHYS